MGRSVRCLQGESLLSLSLSHTHTLSQLKRFLWQRERAAALAPPCSDIQKAALCLKVFSSLACAFLFASHTGRLFTNPKFKHNNLRLRCRLWCDVIKLKLRKSKNAHVRWLGPRNHLKLGRKRISGNRSGPLLSYLLDEALTLASVFCSFFSHRGF